MTVELSEEQRQAVRRGEAVRIVLDELGELVVVPAKEYDAMVEEERNKAAWARLARNAACSWGKENAFE